MSGAPSDGKAVCIGRRRCGLTMTKLRHFVVGESSERCVALEAEGTGSVGVMTQ